MVTNSSSAGRPSPSPSLLREQLAQFDGGGAPSAAGISGRQVFGGFMTLCGLCISGWVIYAIHAAIFHPEKLGLPLKLIEAEDLSMTLPSGKIQLPVIAVRLVGYLLAVLLLAIAGKIAVAQLRLGASIFGHRSDADLKNLPS